MQISKERCSVPCEVFGEKCWVRGRSAKGISGDGLLVFGFPFPKPKLLCSAPDIRGGYKLYPCPYVTLTGRVRKRTARWTKLDDFRRAFIVRKIKRFLKEETDKLNERQI